MWTPSTEQTDRDTDTFLNQYINSDFLAQCLYIYAPVASVAVPVASVAAPAVPGCRHIKC